MALLVDGGHEAVHLVERRRRALAEGLEGLGGLAEALHGGLHVAGRGGDVLADLVDIADEILDLLRIDRFDERIDRGEHRVQPAGKVLERVGEPADALQELVDILAVAGERA